MARTAKHPIRQVCYDRFVASAKKTNSEKGESYHLAYCEFIKYFAQLESITIHDFIIGAHFIYGWMPTMLTLSKPTEYEKAVGILNLAREGKAISDQELLQLTTFVNNSLIGVSKLLHFIRPDKFAIWDSRVCKFIYDRQIAESPENGVKRYMAYLDNCKNLANHTDFNLVHSDICNKIGFEISPFRAIEWVMYMQGK